ncbi:MAG: hypothetical protein M3450_05685 [Actinomycetota bacterium]|nr:hypothetical protein [Actinomycetota bacterium]
MPRADRLAGGRAGGRSRPRPRASDNTEGLAVAFAGSYTTWSTFPFETVRLIEERTLAGAFPPARASGGEADA